MKKIVLLAFFLMIAINGMSQDSLTVTNDIYQEWIRGVKNTDSDSARVNYLNLLANWNKFSRPDSGIYYATKGIELARAIGDTEQELNALNHLALSYRTIGNSITSYRINLEALRKAEEYGSDQKGVFLMSLGSIMINIQNFDESVEYYQKAINEFYRTNNESLIPVSYANLAWAYNVGGKTDSAFYYGFRAKDLAESLNYVWVKSFVYGRLGDIHRTNNDIDSALYYTNLAITIRSRSDRSVGFLQDMASLYMAKQQPDSALYYAQESLDLALSNKLYRNVSQSALFFSEYYENNDPVKALEYHKMALAYKDSIEMIGQMTGFADLIQYDDLQREADRERSNQEFQAKLRTYGFIASIFILLLIAGFLYRNNRNKHRAQLQIEAAYNQLKSAQEQLVQQEKLASLGQLTAGIAHEIKNPLNFVNNFSEVSLEMIDEAIDETRQAGDNPHNLETISILTDIKSNLTKIHEHGSRADGVVKSMLQHSRGGSGVLEPTDLNGLVKEYVNLSYHGMRAGKNPIDVDIELNLDQSIGQIPLIAEDFSRVILNVCNNGFDALREKGQGRRDKGEEFAAKLCVRTRGNDHNVTIEIEDNGMGIPDDIKDKILQPFFTTKKGTQGTGLGLSITHDIIKAHGGSVEVYSKPGQTVFKIGLFN